MRKDLLKFFAGFRYVAGKTISILAKSTFFWFISIGWTIFLINYEYADELIHKKDPTIVLLLLLPLFMISAASFIHILVNDSIDLFKNIKRFRLFNGPFLSEMDRLEEIRNRFKKLEERGLITYKVRDQNIAELDIAIAKFIEANRLLHKDEISLTEVDARLVCELAHDRLNTIRNMSQKKHESALCDTDSVTDGGQIRSVPMDDHTPVNNSVGVSAARVKF